MRFYLRKSPITLTINRSFRKIDDTLSYIGGLFSAMLMFLGIVSLYNEISYGVEIIRNSYYPDKDKPFDGNFLNFLTYLRYLVFLGFDKIGVELDWP